MAPACGLYLGYVKYDLDWDDYKMSFDWKNRGGRDRLGCGIVLRFMMLFYVFTCFQELAVDADLDSHISSLILA